MQKRNSMLGLAAVLATTGMRVRMASSAQQFPGQKAGATAADLEAINKANDKRARKAAKRQRDAERAQ